MEVAQEFVIKIEIKVKICNGYIMGEKLNTFRSSTNQPIIQQQEAMVLV